MLLSSSGELCVCVCVCVCRYLRASVSIGTSLIPSLGRRDTPLGKVAIGSLTLRSQFGQWL